MDYNYTRLPCPSPTLGAYSNSCPLSQWCCPNISSSVVSFSSCPQSFLASRSLLMSRLSSHQMTKVLEFQLQHHSFQWIFKTDLINWFDLAIQGTLKSLLQHHRSKASILWHSAFFMVQFPHSYMTTGKIIALNRCTFVGKVMSLLLNMLSRCAIAFLPRSKCLLISRLQSPSEMIFGAQENKVC